MARKSKEVSNAQKQKNPKNKKRKTTLVFDDTARESYLTGFSKRKAERKRVAHERILEDLKEEKKQLRLEKRKELNEKWGNLNLKLEFEHIVTPTVYDLKEHTVTVTDVSEVDFASTAGLKIGINKVEVEDSEDEAANEKTSRTDEDSDQSGDEKTKDNDDEDKKKAKKRQKKKQHKNLTHLMSKNNQAKKRKKRKVQSKLPSNIKTNADRIKIKKRRNP